MGLKTKTFINLILHNIGLGMKVSSKIVEDVVTQVAGQEILPLVKYLKDKKNVSEFKLADSMKKEVNIIRNMLYKLYDNNLVTFVRKKDKKKGWYIYYWTFEPKKIKHLIHMLNQKRLAKLKDRLERETQGIFYECPNKCIRLDFDQAFNFNFKCPECGQLINQESNEAKIKDIKKEILWLEKEVNIPLSIQKESIIKPALKIPHIVKKSRKIKNKHKIKKKGKR